MLNPKKATKLMSDYSKNNYNAKKTLLENGYSEKTADKASKVILDRASEVVNESLNLDITDTKTTAKNVLDILGMTKEDVIKELLKVITQDRDYTNKLRALAPALKACDIQLEDDAQQLAPSLNLTVENVQVKTPHPTDDGDTIRDSIADTD